MEARTKTGGGLKKVGESFTAASSDIERGSNTSVRKARGGAKCWRVRVRRWYER